MAQRRVFLVLVWSLLLTAALAACAQRPTYGPPETLPRGVTSEGRHFLGDEQAVLDVVLYEDFASELSRRLHEETEPQFIEHYIQGKRLVRFISVPIVAVSRGSGRAAEAALCMGQFGKYWEYRDALYANQQNMPFDREHLANLAERLGVKKERFYACYDLHRFTDTLTNWNDQAKSKGVEGAPTFEIAGQLVPGFRPFDDAEMPGLRQVIDLFLLQEMSQ